MRFLSGLFSLIVACLLAVYPAQAESSKQLEITRASLLGRRERRYPDKEK